MNMNNQQKNEFNDLDGIAASLFLNLI
jgi:hypothetical protein